MATYDPQRARMRGRDVAPTTPADDTAPAPVDLLLGATPTPADAPVAVDAPVAADAPPSATSDVVAAPAPSRAHEHAGPADHVHGPECDHDHGGIDVRVLAGAGAAAALTVVAIVRARRRRRA